MNRNGKAKSSTPPTTESQGVAKRTISAPGDLFKAADAIMEQRMIDTFSEYVRSLIRKDLAPAKKEVA